MGDPPSFKHFFFHPSGIRGYYVILRDNSVYPFCPISPHPQQNAHCNESLVWLRPLDSGTASLLLCHGNSSLKSCCCPKSWRSCSYSAGPAPSCTPAEAAVREGQPKAQLVVLGGSWDCRSWPLGPALRWERESSQGHVEPAFSLTGPGIASPVPHWALPQGSWSLSSLWESWPQHWERWCHPSPQMWESWSRWHGSRRKHIITYTFFSLSLNCAQIKLPQTLAPLLSRKGFPKDLRALSLKWKQPRTSGSHPGRRMGLYIGILFQVIKCLVL